ncbi:hypothetical protein BDZ88DRAFT_21203 [Geranomyces variabilis]|nr:hypothetical protein BDZ88DRAFT_21203 [Geranomyces variabilis]
MGRAIIKCPSQGLSSSPSFYFAPPLFFLWAQAFLALLGQPVAKSRRPPYQWPVDSRRPPTNGLWDKSRRPPPSQPPRGGGSTSGVSEFCRLAVVSYMGSILFWCGLCLKLSVSTCVLAPSSWSAATTALAQVSAEFFIYERRQSKHQQVQVPASERAIARSSCLRTFIFNLKVAIFLRFRSRGRPATRARGLAFSDDCLAGVSKAANKGQIGHSTPLGECTRRPAGPLRFCKTENCCSRTWE